MSVEFVELPPQTHGQGRVKELGKFAAALRSNPGAWALYPFPAATTTHAITRGSQIRTGKLANFASGFEAEVRGTDVYVRYVG